MRERYCLSGLRDEELLGALSGLVKTGNALNADVLAHLAELDERRLYLELGFSSLFAYCMEALGMDESSAGRRITAARVCRRYPYVFLHVANGALGLSVLCALNPYLNPENAAELFEACSNKSRRRVEEILAARFPKPDVRDLIRRVPNPAEIGAPNAPSLPSVPGSASPNPNPNPSLLAWAPPRRLLEVPARRIEPLSADRYGFHFTADAKLKEKLERARALLSHELPGGEMVALFDLALDALIQDREKRRFGVGRKPRRVAKRERAARAAGDLCADDSEQSASAPGSRSPGERGESADPASEALRRGLLACTARRAKGPPSRHIPAAVARQVYVRDAGRCSFISKDGRRCNCRVFLEIDHVLPFAAGGAAAVENLRLRCRAHNDWHALRYFGRARVEAALSQRKSILAQTIANEAAPDTGTQSDVRVQT